MFVFMFCSCCVSCLYRCYCCYCCFVCFPVLYVVWGRKGRISYCDLSVFRMTVDLQRMLIGHRSQHLVANIPVSAKRAIALYTFLPCIPSSHPVQSPCTLLFKCPCPPPNVTVHKHVKVECNRPVEQTFIVVAARVIKYYIYVYNYIYVCIHTDICNLYISRLSTYIYIYIYIERERENNT